MTVFAALVARAGDAGVALPEACVSALHLAGTTRAVVAGSTRFSAAAAQTRPSSTGMCVAASRVVVGDVRLDGRRELRAELAREADRNADVRTVVTLSSGDDLALVAAAHAAWGDDALQRLRGDFSFVLWDSAQQTTLAARDGLGVRPLYFATVRGTTIVSNTLNAVRALPGVASTLNERAVVSFLQYGWNLDTTTTTFTAIRRLAPGTAFRIAADGSSREWRHWEMPDPAPRSFAHEGEYVERYRALLEAAVAERLEAPATTLFLSGGIDSTTIAAAATRVAPAGTRLAALTTRIVGVETGEESRLARLVADRLGIPHTITDEPAVVELAARRHTPEPCDDPEFAGNCAYLERVSRDAGVVLYGEDGDALFSPPGLADLLRRYPVWHVLRDLAMYTLRHRHHPYLGFWLRRRLRLGAAGHSSDAPVWLTPGARAVTPPDEPAHTRNGARPEAATALSGSIWQSLHEGCDRAYHGAALEHRWPLLDTRLIEFVFAIPPIPWSQRKHLARRAYARDLPAEVIGRPKTSVPGYFRHIVEDWRRRTGATVGKLHERTAAFVDADALSRVLRDGDDESVLMAWRALQFDHWVRRAEVS